MRIKSAKHNLNLRQLDYFAGVLGKGKQRYERELEASIEPTSRPVPLISLKRKATSKARS